MSAEATAWVWRCSPWRGQHAKFVLHLAVADVVNDAHGNEFWMSHSALAAKVGCCRETVARWFAEAIEAGLVSLKRDGSRAGGSNCYVFLFAGGVTSDHRGCDLKSQGGVTSDHTELKRELKGTQTSNDAQIVFDAWVAATGRDAARAKLNAKRVQAVKARLREGYSLDDLVAAVRGIALSAWHQGENPDGKKYDDMLVAIRDGGRVEKFRDLFESGGDRPRQSAVDRLLGSAPSQQELMP